MAEARQGIHRGVSSDAGGRENPHAVAPTMHTSIQDNAVSTMAA
jgi:hypothetical protein